MICLKDVWMRLVKNVIWIINVFSCWHLKNQYSFMATIFVIFENELYTHIKKIKKLYLKNFEIFIVFDGAKASQLHISELKSRFLCMSCPIL